MCVIDREAILQDGYFQGYSIWTWYSILLQGFGGLLVAYLVKYADSIIKVLATTLAFIFSSVASIYIFDFKIGIWFVVGSTIVLIGLFSKYNSSYNNCSVSNVHIGNSTIHARSIYPSFSARKYPKGRLA